MHASKAMTLLKKDDDILVDSDAIEQHVLSYFSSLYAAENECIPNELIAKVVPK